MEEAKTIVKFSKILDKCILYLLLCSNYQILAEKSEKEFIGLLL